MMLSADRHRCSIDETEVKCNDLINVKLKYIMGQGIETIETKIL